MRNQVCKTQNVNCANSFFLTKLSLKLIYANEVNIDKLQLNMNSYGI